MGGSKRAHCDKLVTTVCMLCILCAPHSHCSVHEPQLPMAPFHHGRAKMGRPPDTTESVVHARSELPMIPKSANFNSQSLSFTSSNDLSLKHGSYLPSEKASDRSSSSPENSAVSSVHLKHSVPVEHSVSSSPGHDNQLESSRVSNSHSRVRSRRSGDHLISPLTNTDFSGDWSPFLEEIFKEFGDGKVINVEGFQKMLSVLRVKKPNSEVAVNEERRVSLDAEVTSEQRLVDEKTGGGSSCPQSELEVGKTTFRLPRNFSIIQHSSNNNSNSFPQWHCLTAPEILTVAEVGGVGGSAGVNRSDFVHRLCPALIYGSIGATESWIQEAETSSSTHLKDHHSSDAPEEVESTLVLRPSSDPEVWLWASLSVIGISLCGLLGVAVIPVMQKVYYHQLLQFLVALAVGTLCGDALIHLLPHAMAPLGHHHHDEHHHDPVHPEQADKFTEEHHDANMWKGLVAMFGLVFFFTTEKFLIFIGDWRKKQQRKKKPVPSRVRVMQVAGPSSAMEGGTTGQVLASGADVLLGPSSCGSNSPRISAAAGSNSVGEKLCKHKYSSYPYCYGEITTGEIVNESVSAPCAEEKLVNQEKKTRQRRRQNGCSESIAESGDDKLEKLMVRDGSEGFVKSPIEAIGRGYLDTQQQQKEENEGGGEGGREEEDEEEGGGNSYTVILREHERPHHGHSHTHGHVHSAPESISSVAWMVVMGDGLHNFTDGMAIGAAFADGIAGGFSTAVAVFCHELPHELGDFAVLLKAGMTAKQAVFYNLFSSILCYFGMIIGIFLGDTEVATQWIFAAAAGMFLYIALVDMIPELTTSHSKESGSSFQSVLQFIGLLCGVGIMVVIALHEHELKEIFSRKGKNQE